MKISHLAFRDVPSMRVFNFQFACREIGIFIGHWPFGMLVIKMSASFIAIAPVPVPVFFFFLLYFFLFFIYCHVVLLHLVLLSLSTLNVSAMKDFAASLARLLQKPVRAAVQFSNF